MRHLGLIGLGSSSQPARPDERCSVLEIRLTSLSSALGLDPGLRVVLYLSLDVRRNITNTSFLMKH